MVKTETGEWKTSPRPLRERSSPMKATPACRFQRRTHGCLGLFLTLLALPGPAAAAELISHWPLSADGSDGMGPNHAQTKGAVTFRKIDGRAAAAFNGRDAYLEIPDSASLALGTGDFTLVL